MNIKELSMYIGKTGFIDRAGMQVEVIVKDVKVTYGHLRYLVCPTTGGGETWVQKVEFKQ